MSYFRKAIEEMPGYVPGEQPQDNEYIKLNTNENPYPPSPQVTRALRRIQVEKLRKYPDPTAATFRKRAAEVFGVRPEMILAGNGSDDLLTIVVRSFAGVGDLIAYPWPTYSLYPVLAAIQQAKMTALPFDDDFSLPDGLADVSAKVVFVCNPNSPSGTMIDPEKLAWLAGKIDGVLVVDEAYVDFAEVNCLHLVGRYRNVIVLRTLSKGYSLAGLRFGFAVADPQLIAGMNKVKDSYNCDAVAIELATVAIGQQDYLATTVKKVCHQRRYLTDRLGRLGLRVLPSQANFLWGLLEDVSAKLIYQTLKQRGILVRYFDEDGLKDGLRITVGRPAENRRLISQLKQIMADVKGDE